MKKNIFVIIAGIAVMAGLLFSATFLYNKLSSQSDSGRNSEILGTIKKNKEESEKQHSGSSDGTGTQSGTDKADSEKEETDGEKHSENDTTTAPDFTVYKKDGSAVTLREKFGKPIIINFWAT